MVTWKPKPLVTDVESLPFGRFLTERDAADGAVASGEDHDCALWRDVEWHDIDGVGCRLSESAMTGVTVHGGALARSRWHDSWIARSRLLGTDLTESDWRDVDVLGCSLAGVAASGATLRRVRFSECKLASLNLRFATLTDVVFDRCEITDVDLASATCKNVTFPGSSITGLRLNTTTLTAVDFRGAATLGVAGDVASLRGAVIDSSQLAELAPALALGLGVVVNDRPAR